MKRFFKKIGTFLKGKIKNWQVLAAIGFDYLSENLSGRIKISNVFFSALFEKVMDMGADSVVLLTDDDVNDAQQMRELLQANMVDLISITAAGAVTEIKNDDDRLKVIAIMEDACNKLKAGLKS